MSTHTRYRGAFTIEPPLTWPEIQVTEAWAGHPDHFAASYHNRCRYGTRLLVDEQSVDTSDGTLVRRTASVVEIFGEELCHDDVMDDLRALALQHGATHDFVGTLDCREDHPDTGTPFRVRIVGTAVEEIWPVMFWPDDLAADEIRNALSRFDRTIDQRGELAKAVLRHLVATYTQKG